MLLLFTSLEPCNIAWNGFFCFNCIKSFVIESFFRFVFIFKLVENQNRINAVYPVSSKMEEWTIGKKRSCVCMDSCLIINHVLETYKLRKVNSHAETVSVCTTTTTKSKMIHVRSKEVIKSESTWKR